MNSSRYVLKQAIDRIYWQRLTRLAEHYNIRTRNFVCRQQLICMGFAQLTWRESLRDIEECLNAKGPAALYHVGLREPVARVTLATANEQRDWRGSPESALFSSRGPKTTCASRASAPTRRSSAAA
jgi:hypothetical protein